MRRYAAPVLCVAVLLLVSIRIPGEGAARRAQSPLAKERYEPQLWSKPEPLRYGFLKPGVTLFAATSTITAPPWRVVFLRAGRVTRRLEASGDVAGYVQIRSPQDALTYTQFLISRGIRTTASDPYWRELRVVAQGDRTAEWLDYDWKPGEPHRRAEGALYKAEWDTNKLSEPTVKRAGEDFIVTRWLWTTDRGKGAYAELASIATDVVWLVSHRVSLDGRVKEKALGKRRLRGVKIVTPILR